MYEMHVGASLQLGIFCAWNRLLFGCRIPLLLLHFFLYERMVSKDSVYLLAIFFR